MMALVVAVGVLVLVQVVAVVGVVLIVTFTEFVRWCCIGTTGGGDGGIGSGYDGKGR